MKKTSVSPQQSSQLFNKDFAEAVAKNIKDPKKAELATEMMQAASNGNRELADVLTRIIKAELDSIKSSAS